MKRLALIALLITTSSLLTTFIVAYGHGVGSETLPPVMLGGRNVTLSIGETQSSPDSSASSKEITIHLFETNSKNPVKDVTFLVEASQNGKTLFKHQFQRDDGALMLDIVTTPSSDVLIQEEGKDNFFGSLFSGNTGSALVTGPIFGSGGLYNFQINVTTADSYGNKLEPPIKYNAAISIPDTTFYDITDKQYGKQRLKVITYYDKISNFAYDEKSRSITFSMPFDWSDTNLSQVSIVHEEVFIPKTFVGLIAPQYDVSLNGLVIPPNSVTIDDYSSDDRIVHVVLNKPELAALSSGQDGSKNGMNFKFSPSSGGFQLTQYTKNLQYKINLRWEPNNIVSGSDTKFFFEVQDAYLISNKTISASYDFSLIKDGNVIFTKSDVTGQNQNLIEVPIPAGLSGTMTARFENVGGNEYANADFPLVISEQAPAFPIKLTSVSSNNPSMPGKYEVDLTWFPSSIQIDDQAEFVFTIWDKNTGLPVSQASYDFVIIQGGKEVFRKSGISSTGGDFVDYSFSKGQEGPIEIRLEKINNSDELVRTTIVVTPEFPLGSIAVFAAVLFLAIFQSYKKLIVKS